MKLSLFIAFFFFIQIGAHAQGKDFLLLKRGKNQKSQLRYYPGESITYKSKKLGYFITDQIVSLDTDYIYLKENILSPSDILEVGIRDKDPRNSTLRNLTALFLGAGGILMTVEAVNSIYQQSQLQIDQGVAITSGILIGTGLALLPLRYKTFKNTTGYGIQIILMRME
ncbi:hypothetical protein [Algoriphagus sp.]|jgi:hypothetical protein|uniref:hypothetical protein n=1 Tax=Algoriphagus sp. TaxID=1872435 RepID=UPI0027216514|nr:hypothetical protein [Algoriphagus sp.]MDO8967259.1 hypothetical protein [Algoriphagus sp.]MDP3199641.1 hypothetical protein [Algoriphagus sp.]